MNRALRVMAIAALAIATPPARIANAQLNTLHAVLANHGIPPGTLARRDLEREITSFGVENSADLFAVGFYELLSNRNALADSLRIVAFDKAARHWTTAAIPREQPLTGDIKSIDLGSVIDVQHSETRIYVRTHLNPSAAATLVLGRDLKPVTVVLGWGLSFLADEVLLYHRNQVHFAPTHSAELWTYDPRTGRDTLVYPRAPISALRRRYVSQVKAIYDRLGEDWFRENNHHMNPELFNSSLRDSVMVSADGRAFAAIIQFGEREARPAATPVLDVLVQCRVSFRATVTCTEQELAAAKRQYPGLSNAELLSLLVNS